MDAYHIIEKIEILRKERNWSTYKLAEESGITQSALFNMRARGTMPSVTTLACLCDAFGISLSEFFSESDGGTLSDGEKKLVGHYRRLPYREKQAVLKLVESLDNEK